MRDEDPRPTLGPLPRTLFGYRADAVRALADQMDRSDRAHYEAWRDSLTRTEARLSGLRARREALEARRMALAETAGFLAASLKGTETMVGYVETSLDAQIETLREAHAGRMRDMNRQADRLEQEIARARQSLTAMTTRVEAWLDGETSPVARESITPGPDLSEGGVRAFSQAISLLKGHSRTVAGSFSDAAPLGNGLVRLALGPEHAVIRTRGDGPVGVLDGLAVTPNPLRIVGYLVGGEGEVRAIPAADAVSVRAGLLEVRDGYRLLLPGFLPLHEMDTTLQVLGHSQEPYGPGSRSSRPRLATPVWTELAPPGPEKTAGERSPDASADGAHAGVATIGGGDVVGPDPGVPDTQAIPAVPVREEIPPIPPAALPAPSPRGRFPAPIWFVGKSPAPESTPGESWPSGPPDMALPQPEVSAPAGAELRALDGSRPAGGEPNLSPVSAAAAVPAVGTGFPENRTGALPDPDPVLAFLEGKIVGRELTDARGSVLARAGDPIDRALVRRAEQAGRLPELIVYMTLPGVPSA